MDHGFILNGIGSICHVARELGTRGWAEDFSGNISINLGRHDTGRMKAKRQYHHDLSVEDIVGCTLLITRSGSTMGEISNDPWNHIGIYRVLKGSLDLLQGEGPPTSEIGSHLLIHGIGGVRGVIHCHLDNMDRFVKDDVLENGFGWVDELEPGSPELASATLEAAGRHDAIIWDGHGVICSAENLERALDLVFKVDDQLPSRNQSMLVPRE